jgi:Ca2+-binding EF-hand superfamily protein/1-acyl-sn-glycerol-3-phosphate acyltransferase
MFGDVLASEYFIPSVVSGVLALGAVRVYVHLGKFVDRRARKAEDEIQLPTKRVRRYSDHLHQAYLDAVGENSTNPFVNETRFLSQYERVKMSVMTVTVMPVRVLAIILILLSIVLWSQFVGLVLCCWTNDSKPIPSCVRFILGLPIRVAMRLMLFCFGYYYISVKGSPASAAEAPMLVANHISFIEPLFLLYRCLPMSVGNHSMIMMPGLAPMHKLFETIPLKKYVTPDVVETKYSRAWVKQTMKERATSGGRWPQLLVFPTGTTHNQHAIVHFKVGAFLPGVPVQPILIRYPFKHFDNSWVPGGPQAPELLHRLLCQFVNHMSVEFMPVYTPTANEAPHNPLNRRKEDALVLKRGEPPRASIRSGGKVSNPLAHVQLSRATEDEKNSTKKATDTAAEKTFPDDYKAAKLYAGNVRQVMADRLGCGTTEHSYEDIKLADIAFSLHLPATDAMIEIGKAKPLLGENVTLETIEKHLSAFAAMDTEGTGRVSFEQFAEAFGLMRASGGDSSSSSNNGCNDSISNGSSFNGSGGNGAGMQLRRRSSWVGRFVQVGGDDGGGGGDDGGDPFVPGAKALFEMIDHDECGSIAFKDYLFGLALLNESPTNRQQLIKLAFNVFDVSGDGTLSIAEFASLLAFNSEMTSRQVEDTFAQIDTDSDGKISYEEFAAHANEHEELVGMFHVSFLDRSEMLARKKAWRPRSSIANGREAAKGGKGGGRGKARAKGKGKGKKEAHDVTTV